MTSVKVAHTSDVDEYYCSEGNRVGRIVGNGRMRDILNST